MRGKFHMITSANLKQMLKLFAYIMLSWLVAQNVYAQGNNGPVASNCKKEIRRFCADKSHLRGEVRLCLEENKTNLSKSCRKALETTGKGRRYNRGY